MPNMIIPFDTARHHIYIKFFVTHPLSGSRHSFNGILDTGAPRTEFADVVLSQIGFIANADHEVGIGPGLQTQKYGKTVLPSIEICGHIIQNFEVLVSRFEKSWGIAALIGLDFFRRFRVAIDYEAGLITTEPFSQK